MPTFLFTDIEGSTQKWEKHPEIMSKALELHNRIIRAQLERHGGKVVKHTGDGLFAVFVQGRPVHCLVEIQKAIQGTAWGPIGDLRVRSVLHAGPARKVGEDYFGPVVNRTARILAAGWGGQMLLTPEVVNLHEFPERVKLHDLGVHRLKDLTRPQPLFGLLHPECALKEFPALRSEGVAGETVSEGDGEARHDTAPAAESPPVHQAAPRGFRLAETFDQTHAFVLQGAYAGRGRQNGRFMLPAGVAVDASGRVYVTDAIQGSVQIFELDGSLVSRMGALGGILDPGLAFNNPAGIAVDGAGRIYVCDTKNGQVKVFTMKGDIVHQIGRPLVVIGRSAPPGVVGFNHPRGIALDEPAGKFYVADTGNHRIQAFSLDGVSLGAFGQYGQRDGEFVHPIGIAVGPDERVYVADSDNYRVQVFARGWEFERAFGRRGTEPGDFSRPPVGVATTPDGEVLVCSGTDRIEVFGPDGSHLGGVSGWRKDAEPAKYVAVALREPEDLVAADDNACQWHHYKYREATE